MVATVTTPAGEMITEITVIGEMIAGTDLKNAAITALAMTTTAMGSETVTIVIAAGENADRGGV